MILVDSKNNLVWLFAFLIGITFSIRWAYPLYEQAKSKGQFAYVPIRYGTKVQSDDYFYYSYIREIIDGNLFSCDPATYENKNKPSAHITYRFSLLMCSIGGLFTKNTAHAYYFNYFVYPALNFFLIYYLFFLLTNLKHFSIFSSLLIIFFQIPFRPKDLLYVIKEFSSGGNVLFFNISRTPNILFTNIQLFILVILLFLILEKQKKSLFLSLSLIFILGISSLTTIQNFFISYSIYMFFMLVYFRDKRIRRDLLVYFFVALIISIPGIIFIIKAQSLSKELFSYAIPIVGLNYYGVGLKWFLSGVKLLFIPFLFLLFVEFPYKKFVLSVISGIIFIYLLFTFTIGTYVSGKIISRGAELLFSSLVISALIAFISDIVIKQKVSLVIFKKQRFTINLSWLNLDFLKKKAFLKGLRLSLASISLFLILCCAFNQYQIYKHSYINYNGKEFKELYLWVMKHTKTNEVALTLDFDLLTNLIVYAPSNVYIPQAILSPTPSQERYQRFYETLKFYGFTPEEIRVLLGSMISHSQITIQKDNYCTQMALMQLVLFYGKYYDTPISEKEKDEMVQEYARVYNNGGIKLSFKSNYLIVSKFDEAFVHNGSVAAEIIKNNKIMFKNNFYEVYKL